MNHRAFNTVLDKWVHCYCCPCKNPGDWEGFAGRHGYSCEAFTPQEILMLVIKNVWADVPGFTYD